MLETSAPPENHHPTINTPLNEKETKLITEKALMAEHIISVSESTNTLLLGCDAPTSRPQAGVLSRFSKFLSSAGWQINPRDEGETEMSEIRDTGRELRQLAENCALQSDANHRESSPSALSLTSKVGLLIGAGLLAGTGGSLAYRRIWATDCNDNSTTLNRAEVFPLFNQHDAQMANRSADNYAGQHVIQGEPLPQPAARALPRGLRISKQPERDDVKKIAIADLICYETVGVGRMVHRRIAPCKNSLPDFAQHKPRSKPPRKYYYTNNQPDICSSTQFEAQCQNFHHAQKNKNKVFNRVVLNVGKIRCLCPPPVGEKVEIISPHKSSEKINKVKGGGKTSDRPNVSFAYTNATMAVQTEMSIYPVSEVNNTTISTLFEEVKIERLFDFSCIDERENISWSDIIRQVGKTLASPIRTLGDESLIIHYHNTLGQGCPPNQTTERVDQINGKIDSVTTQILTLLPGSQVVAVAQLIVAPALQVLADDLSGRSVNLQSIAGINQQLMFMIRQTIPTLSGTEMVSLYENSMQEKGQKGVATGDPVKRFILKDKKLAVEINGKSYSYHRRKTGESYIYDGDDTRVIAYNKSKFQWDFISKDKELIYSSYNVNYSKAFGIPINKFVKNRDSLLRADNENTDIISLNSKDGGVSEYVLIRGYLVSIEQYDFFDSTTSVAISPKRKEMSILLSTEYGWVFEEESTLVDENLDVLLGSNGNGKTITHDNLFSNIMNDGFSYDQTGKFYLKYKQKYYESCQPFSNIYNIVDRPESLFFKENGIFKLRNSPDIIFGYRNLEVGFPDLEPITGTSLRIEEDAYNFLCLHGKVADTIPVRKIGHGVYVDGKGKMLFTVNNKHFSVSSYTKDYVVIHHEIDMTSENDIGLFLSSDIYLREREAIKDNILNYIEIDHCDLKRSPGIAPGCTPCVITESLDTLLKHNIELGHASKKTILTTKLVQYKMPEFPGLFVNPEKNKYYYLHDGHFFSAEIISSDSKDNAASRAMVRIFTKGDIFRRKKDIANIVFDSRDGRIELKTQVDFLAEKLGVRKGAVNSYLNNRIYNSIGSLDTIKNVVDQVLMSKRFLMPNLREKYIPYIDDENVKDLIAKHFYSSRIRSSENTVELSEVKRVTDSYPLYLRGAKTNVENAVNHLNVEVIPAVIKELSNFSQNCENYLRIVMDTDNVEFLRSFALNIKKCLVRIQAALKLNKIRLASLVKEPLTDHMLPGDEIVHHRPILTEEERQFGTLAFTLLDRSGRIYINADKLYFVDPTHPDQTMREDPVITLSSTLLHEASHVGMMASDIVYFPLENGDIIPVLDAKDDMIEKIRVGKIVEKNDFNELNKQYLSRISLYRGRMEQLMESENLAYLASHDPGYLAHLFLNTADGIALLTRDIYQNRQVKND
ncbi:hypothetical protein [Erwinia piriflorinigrans]|uniref:Uncharacterized protein n=1 Tax=Erwinia piriflorinigrans CFBP 5888 TaxID=1161919 RepID=V5ZA02_9GAMM|nr:hypothetical protein [Erwinia piriflorinigrans]CCG87861.1 hypothetical protein EPIR_2498 [Erwinia piriflorinigrans CFBP 5888]